MPDEKGPSDYRSMFDATPLGRRGFLKAGGVAGAGLMLGHPAAWAEEQSDPAAAEKPATNIEEIAALPRTAQSLPGPWPGRVVEVHDPKAMNDDGQDAGVIADMFERGLAELTGLSSLESFDKLLDDGDVVGIKVNPVGAGLISTRLELVDAIIAWLEQGGIPRSHIVIWDRFDYMLADAGFTPERYPGVRIEGLQTMDEAAFAEGADQSGWLTADGKHVSEGNFDLDVVYWADIEASQDQNYLHQHVLNDKRSPFGKLVTRDLTKIINVPVFKNTGNGISMATKNLGYGAICNTARLHRPLFFDVCTEVCAFPAIRDKLVLNVTDGLRGQYEGGPMPVAANTYIYNRIFLATDIFALDLVCHDLMVLKRKEMGIAVNEHPRFTDYLRYAQRLGLGIADPERIEVVRA
jgi:hypothetical protein